MAKFDFSGWATKANLRCSDGRVIMKDAFKQNDGQKVPLVWNHQHNNPEEVLGHALLENRDDGVYAYCSFNDTPSGKTAKLLVEHGDVNALSIYANELKQSQANVMHGNIREVSLVLAGANPGAFIESVMMAHGEESEEEAIVYSGETISLYNSEYAEGIEELEHSDKEEEGDTAMANQQENVNTGDDKTVQDVIDTMTEEQKTVLYALVGQALEESGNGGNSSEEENMKHNIFDNDNEQATYLSHSDEKAILDMAKSNTCGSFQAALESFANDSLAHGIDDIDTLFPEYTDINKGAPVTIERDQTWIDSVINGAHKSPISRIRTRWADARGTDLRAYGYQKGDEKKVPGNIKLLKRTTDPQTVYRKDALHRDDIVDITEFDVVEYQYGIMKNNLMEELALAIMVGDGREDGDDMKISEEHIRSIWHDDDFYCIHYDIDLDAAKDEIQGSDTSKNFGENYIYEEAFVNASLYSREKYKGSGNMSFYCTPHLLNQMLLARDLNGRRIYSSKSELEAALNVKSIVTVEQFDGLTRTTSDSKTKKLLGIFVNMSDYQIGSTKGGEITRFNQFDIDFNQEKYLIETRVSGALIKPWSAIAIEEDVTA